ncbi:MAG: CHASE2 domain-containing protein [Waterburya sp.]
MTLAQLLGLLRPLEVANYDLLFYLNPTETRDKRIVLVEWNEESIQALKESTISDHTLVTVLNKILEQKPRVIGLDLYRDIPVYSPSQSIEANIQANKSLNKIFLSHSNIIGIQKIREPKVPPPKSLQKQQQVAASDIHPDSDYRIRQVYIFPTTDKFHNPTQIPYIGVVLGYQYLAAEGWQASNAPKGLKIHNQKQQIILNPLTKSFDGFWQKNYGWKFLLHWRKTKHDHDFPTVSVAAIIQNKLEKDFFKDKLVIIGNTTSYSGDWHSTALDRWQKSKLTNGLNIVAQTASSIINAAIAQRNLINSAPYWLEFFLLIIPVICIAKVIENNFNSNSSLIRLQLVTALYGILYGVSIAFISVLGFRIFGLWISVTPALTSICLSWIVLNNYCQVKKEKRDFDYLQRLLRDFKHNLGNITGHIARSNRSIIRANALIAQELIKDAEDAGELEADFFESLLGKEIKAIELETKDIDSEIKRIKHYQKRTSSFLQYTYSNKISQAQKVNLNHVINQTIQNYIQEQNSTYQFDLQTEYDHSMESQTIYLEDIAIILETLVNNAVYAINPELNQQTDYNPTIKIKTTNNRQFIKIIVEDNGVGIPLENQRKIFLPFVSYKQSEGIGLYLVTQIVHSLNGSINLQSQVGQGSRFTISIPKH